LVTGSSPVYPSKYFLMKIIDTVKKSFFEYPTLYHNVDFNSIKFGIMHHMFIVLGNGIEWAKTKTPKNGGYLIEPRYHNRERVYDAKYGKETIDIDITPYIKGDKIYSLELIDHIETERHYDSFVKILTEVKEVSEDKITYYKNLLIAPKIKRGEKNPHQRVWLESEFDKLPPNTLLPSDGYDKKYTYFLREIEKREDTSLLSGIHPYPNFDKQYSCFWKKNAEYIQEDWRIEAINHLSYWKEYFNDSERIKGYSHHPEYNKEREQEFLDILKRQITEGQKPKYVFDNYGYKPFDLNDPNAYQEAIKERWERNLQEEKSFIDETIFKLLK
jgi:hypothetical protein